MNVQIQRADLSEIKQIEDIEFSLKHRLLTYPTLQTTLINKNYYYFIAKLKDNIIGYIAAEFLVDHFDILAIAVLEEYRRQNIASQLINMIFEISKKLNIQDIFLEVRCNNLSAINFYEKMGFKKISVRKNYYTDTNEDAYIYVKNIN